MKGYVVAGYNRIIMIGNLTRDPDYKQLNSGQGVCRLGLASNRQYKNRQTGSMVQEVCFVDVDVYGPQADSCREYLQKGRPVLVEGRLKFDQWESPEGQNRSKHLIVADRVVFLSAGTSAETDQAGTSESSALEKDIMGRVQAAQQAQAAQSVAPQPEPAGAVSNMGEIPLKDEPPFKDDLPF